jgi:hypothetical protein
MSKTEPLARSRCLAGDPEQARGGLAPGRDELVTPEPQTPHIFATGSDHYVQVHDPDLTIGTIALIVERVRRGR